ncbi:disease resistance protein RPV1-like [Eucalyptus grandis]|uniref:disease resistance protein RPV1-like n=1 Tax=Eucalyptus grandis TaxID=71139 RepID=UPI00192EBC1E|nr:disease resistance protein RPV1-like [Eucalyptus grandis]
MYIQTRRRILNFPFSSPLSNSFVLFSLHFPLNLNCQTNWKREKLIHEVLNSGVSSSLIPPHGGDYEGGDEQWKVHDYEVFLSFRGKDTRKGFTDHLYASLVNTGIHVFRDDNELHVGEVIGSELLRSITNSKISIPIISENYAFSKWCLCELAQMLKCRRSGGQIVLPVFYKVKPSHLRHLTGRLGDAIKAHKKDLDDTVVKEWEEALKEVSNLKGWESEKIDNGHEGALVKIVVRKVMNELKTLFLLNVPEQLVGIDDHVEQIMSSIDGEFNDTRIIGIYGMGGIGKTTLAKLLYNKLFDHFEHHSFVANIRETSQRKGIECIQKQLIYDIIGFSNGVSNVDEGISLIKSQFRHKKVLVLLDDMDADTHLYALAENSSWFEAGSIIIITSRNKSILDRARAAPMYQLDELPLDKSLTLFSRHAFRKDYPPSDYKVISCDVVSTTGGLPLALEVIGSFLCGKGEEVWKDTSKKLKKVPDKKVQETLRINYDALDYEEQQIFLDIACFFTGSPKQSLTYMWEACDFYPEKGIEVLRLMSLIKIDKDGKLMMHDQLRDLGREIVRLENHKEPGKRSRLWNHEEVVDVLDNNKGSSKIEALHFGKYDWQESYTAEQFKELTNLRFLHVNGANFTGDFQNLLPQLRWFHWEGCRLDFNIANLHPKKLVMLNLSRSGISEEWGGWDSLKMATKLKVLNLSYCQSLRRTPELSTFENLENLILEHCEYLKEIHPSIGDIKTLVSLDVRKCYRLKELPVGVGRMKELRELLLDHTWHIQDIPISRDCLMKLETLSASFCKRLVQLPESMGSFVSLAQLNLSHSGSKDLSESMGSLVSLTHLDLSYSRIIELPKSMGSLVSLTKLNLCKTQITELPKFIGSLKKLQTLYVRYCSLLARIPSSIGQLASLQDLSLRECRLLREIPNSIGKLASLTTMDLHWTAIEELPESIGSLKKLQMIDASYCASLARIPSAIGHLASLKSLFLQGCCSLREIPDSIGKLASLTELHLKGTTIEELPESIGSLKELETLNVSWCKSLTHIPSSVGDQVSLTHLLLQGCHLLKEIPNSIGKLASLTKLDLSETGIEKLPESIGFLKELETLDASNCVLLAHIPSSIGHLSSLSLLDLRKCHKLTQLPESMGSLMSLTHLYLSWTGIEELPKSINSLKKLKILDASNCASLTCISSSIGHPASL